MAAFGGNCTAHQASAHSIPATVRQLLTPAHSRFGTMRLHTGAAGDNKIASISFNDDLSCLACATSDGTLNPQHAHTTRTNAHVTYRVQPFCFDLVCSNAQTSSPCNAALVSEFVSVFCMHVVCQSCMSLCAVCPPHGGMLASWFLVRKQSSSYLSDYDVCG